MVSSDIEFGLLTSAGATALGIDRSAPGKSNCAACVHQTQPTGRGGLPCKAASLLPAPPARIRLLSARWSKLVVTVGCPGAWSAFPGLARGCSRRPGPPTRACTLAAAPAPRLSSALGLPVAPGREKKKMFSGATEWGNRLAARVWCFAHSLHLCGCVGCLLVRRLIACRRHRCLACAHDGMPSRHSR